MGDSTIQHDTLLTVQEVAKFFRVTEATVRNWIKDDRIPYIRVGDSSIRFRQADLDQYLEEKKTGKKTVRRVSSRVGDVSSEAKSLVSVSDISAMLDMPEEEVQDRITRPECRHALRVDVAAFVEAINNKGDVGEQE